MRIVAREPQRDEVDEERVERVECDVGEVEAERVEPPQAQVGEHADGEQGAYESALIGGVDGRRVARGGAREDDEVVGEKERVEDVRVGKRREQEAGEEDG
ncbi:MAG: hypothetical protein LC785_08635 [Acidobacteria bacterium]|nr:hypothetical protein [Acidobacteriota bacterium]